MEKIDNLLVSRADIVFTASMNLKREKKYHNKNIYFIPNAADVKLLSRSLDPSLKVPDDLAQIASPRIGLIGHINENVDLEIFSMMAEEHPEWFLVLIGKIKGNSVFRKNSLLKKVKSCSNVHLLGWKNYYLPPAYLKGFDVAIMPYKVNEFMHSVNPDKLYQFMAAELPIVSTPIREVTKFKEIIELADEPDSFCTAIKRSIGEKGSRRVKKGLEIACTESWDSKARMAIRVCSMS